MQVVVWIIIIMVIIFLIWLLRRWIKRLIFILILLALAFLIYGIFNPSGAARIWYNVRTFPQRMASWMGSTEKFLDYDSYKLNVSSIGDKIGGSISDKLDLLDDEIVNLDSEEDDDIDSNFGDEEKIQVKGSKENILENDIPSTKGQIIKSFPKSVKFVQFPEIEEKYDSEIIGQLTGYSSSDLLGVINKYIEENLDDYTDILVTVEYEDDNKNPQKIILETQSKSRGGGNSVYFIGSVDELLEKSERNEEDKVESEDELSTKNSSDQVQTNAQPVKKTTSNKLTQKDQQEAEEIFSILF